MKLFRKDLFRDNNCSQNWIWVPFRVIDHQADLKEFSEQKNIHENSQLSQLLMKST
jgi:hypothetical protein